MKKLTDGGRRFGGLIRVSSPQLWQTPRLLRTRPRALPARPHRIGRQVSSQQPRTPKSTRRQMGNRPTARQRITVTAPRQASRAGARATRRCAAPPARIRAGLFSLLSVRRQVRVSEANHDCGMDLILLTPGAVEVVIAVCVALLLGLATYLAIT